MCLHNEKDKRYHLFPLPSVAFLIDWRDILQSACHLQRPLRIESGALVALLLVGNSQARGCAICSQRLKHPWGRGLLSGSLRYHWWLWSYQDLHGL